MTEVADRHVEPHKCTREGPWAACDFNRYFRPLAAKIEKLPRQTQHADPFFPETYDYETVGLDAVLALLVES